MEMDKLPITICLNMIVKNESRIIKRLLQSVLPIIDTYLICDTGSTDDTPNIITNFFNEHNIKGDVISEPFKNFGYNRSFAFNKAKGKATYALLLDADMIFKIDDNFDKQKLSADAYLVIQKGGSMSYYNIRLIKLNINARCLGPTHEYYDIPPGAITEKINSLWITDIGDGGSKADKFERDIRLLKQGIEEEPNNGRYYFYLANSYFNTGRHEESIKYYIKRISIGGWVEEVFYSHLNLGHAYKTIGQTELAISTWMNGYDIHPIRSETIYEITKYYREIGKTKIGMAFCMLGKSIPYPKNDTLFIHNDVYETGFDYELSILGYYNNYPNIHKLLCKLMNTLPIRHDNLLSNYKFCSPNLNKYFIKRIGGTQMTDTFNICGVDYKMFGSNPCLFKIGNDYYINIRFVNYHLNFDGIYQFPVDDGKIATVNKIYKLDNEFNFLNNPLVLIPNNNQLRYVGIEDLKLYSINGNMKLSFLGTIQNPINNNMAIGYGELDLSQYFDTNTMANETNTGDDNGNDNGKGNDKGKICNDRVKYDLSYMAVNTIWNKGCEKNWVFYDNNNIIYSWYPLIIGTIGYVVKKDKDTIETNTLESNEKQLFFKINEERRMPEIFKHIRGSTNGFEYNNEIWFLCHIVEYCRPRQYYHIFVIFEKDLNKNNKLGKLIKWSNLFKFEGEKIEYSLGLIIEEQRILISYSKWDREPIIGIFDKNKIETEIF